MVIIHSIFALVIVMSIYHLSEDITMVKNAYKACLSGVLMGGIISYLIANFMEGLSTSIRIVAILMITVEFFICLYGYAKKYNQNDSKNKSYYGLFSSATGLYILALPFITTIF